jgi:4-amino-4-deoxy-L-arabinose transferase-like glycosyltransferase
MKKRIDLKTSLLLVILVIAAFLRLYHLDSVPPAPSVDEVSTGYNAYSLLLTGRGEHGGLYPLVLQSFDDWQPALYAYLTIPFIYILGLSIVAVRLPAVLLSILTVYITYLLVNELFTLSKSGRLHDKDKTLHEWYALAAAFLLAISPWHIYLSRLGYPANAGLSFFILTVYFLMRRKFVTSMLFFVLSAMSYHTEKVFLPLVSLAFLLVYYKELWLYKKKTITILVFGFILLLPFLYQSFAPGALARLNATSIFRVREEDMARDMHMNLAVARSESTINKIIYNHKALALQYAGRGYLTHFQPTWLFTNMTAAQHKAPNLGLLYPWEAITLAFGIIIFFQGKIDRKKKILLVVWLLAAPVASAFSTSAPHAVRSIVFLPIWQLFSGIGLVRIFLYIASKFHKILPIILYLGIFIVSLIIFYNQYFIVFPRIQSASFQYAISQAMPLILKKESQYDKIVISNQGPLYQSYMYYLFYSRYDPATYYKNGGTGSGGFAAEHNIGKFIFKRIAWDKEEKKKKILYVGSVDEINNKDGLMNEFFDLDGKPEIKLIHTPL